MSARPDTNADEFQCEECQQIGDIEDSVRDGGKLLCSRCAQCPECQRSYGPHYTGRCEH